MELSLKTRKPLVEAMRQERVEFLTHDDAMEPEGRGSYPLMQLSRGGILNHDAMGPNLI